jgi:hypothetical protein
MSGIASLRNLRETSVAPVGIDAETPQKTLGVNKFSMTLVVFEMTSREN